MASVFANDVKSLCAIQLTSSTLKTDDIHREGEDLRSPILTLLKSEIHLNKTGKA
jgi:hypothetical protein